MRVPDLGHMIQVEEIHAAGDCIHCGQSKQLHGLVWRSDLNGFGYQCYRGVSWFYETRYELENESS